MLTFTTLLLGLVAGEQPVELVASAEVARIELAIGGAPCATLDAPPWRARCDFGPAPRPVRLVAAGFDRAGREVARAERIVNLFRAAAELSIHFERAPAGQLRARLAAESFAAGPPRAVRLELDGVALPLAAPVPAEAGVELPEVDLDAPHLLRAEAEWSDTVSAVGEVVFGGRHGETIASELTALAVESERKLTLAALDGAFVAAAGPVRAVAIEEGPAELLVVLDPEAVVPLARRAAIRARVPIGGSTFGRPGGDRQTRRLGGADQRHLFTLGRSDRVRILWPWPERAGEGERAVARFPPSPPFTAADGGLVWILARARLPSVPAEPPALADAAAVAGMIAAGRERRRAVLVLLGPGDADASRLAPEALRAFLASVRVPLFVWRAGERRSGGPDPWGEVATLTSAVRLQAAFRALDQALARQRIVWLEGAHLPNELRLAGARAGLRLAGEPAR